MHLKKLRRAEGGANIFGVFRVKKNHDFTPKKIFFFPILGGACAGGAPPGSAPGYDKQMFQMFFFVDFLPPLVYISMIL
jgi:hypothetical protein